MNLARLIFGWVFLAGLSAAGAFYGMDEIDSRFGLASLKLHDKFGITRYAAAIPKIVTPSTIPVGGPSSADPHAPLPSTPGTPLVPPSTIPSTTPDPTPVTPPAVTPSPVDPPPGPSPVAPAYRPPASPTYPPRSSPAVVPPGPSAAPSRVPEAPRPKDFGEVNDRLIDVKGQADGALSHWNGIAKSLQSSHLSLRPPITAALSSLRTAVTQAEQALRAGDTATARRDLDNAEKQLQILQGFDQ